MLVNHNKAGLFQDSLFWWGGGVNLIPPSYFKKNNVISIKLYAIVNQPI